MGFSFNDFSGEYAFHFSTGIGTEAADPLSLHKFTYSELDPVDQTDPSGNCLPSIAGWGNTIQIAVAKKFLAERERGFFNTPISVILSPYETGIGGALRPDLADADWGDFYEIKSVYSVPAAFAQLAQYEYFLNKYDRKKGRIWFPGITFLPPTPVTISPGTVALVALEYPGCITYCVIDQAEVLFLASVALAGLLASLAELVVETAVALVPAAEGAE
jgi:hypothetical protein